jgi:hypothetical protein
MTAPAVHKDFLTVADIARELGHPYSTVLVRLLTHNIQADSQVGKMRLFKIGRLEEFRSLFTNR